MRLQHVKKNFPEDYQVIPKISKKKGAFYLLEKGQKTRYKYLFYIDDKGEKYGDFYVPKHHSVITRLFRDLAKYDLTDREQRQEFLAVMTAGLLIDHYDQIPDKIVKITPAIKEINAMSDLDGYMNALEKAEEKLGIIMGDRNSAVIQESKTQKANKGKALAIKSFGKTKKTPAKKKTIKKKTVKAK